MPSLTERREFQRFKIPDAKVLFLQEEDSRGTKRVSGEGLIENCSVKGIRFITETKLQSGVKVKLELVIPAKEPVTLEGNIIWCSVLSYKNRTIAVAEFAPFGEGQGYNPMAVKTDLEKIAGEYLAASV